MFEFEEMSTGFHEGFLSKYADSSGPIYDIFISDSMQDMLDIDIRSEVATVVGGSNEFASLVNDLPSLDDVDSASNDGEASWLGGPKWCTGSDFYADVGACVNPNSVMPIISSSLLNSPKVNLNTNHFRQASSPPASPKESKSHLTFSPNQIKIPLAMLDKPQRLPQLTTSLLHNRNSIEAIKKDLVTELRSNSTISTAENKSSSSTKNGGILHSLAPGIGGLTFANTIDYNKFKQQSSIASSKQLTSLSHNGNLVLKRDRDSSPLHNMTTLHSGSFNNSANGSASNKILSRNIVVQNKNHSQTALSHTNSPLGSPQVTATNSNNSTSKNSKQQQPKPIIGPEFPKPAYSYSCLIAMALKNSRSGSLPVSEIYSFMCEHFPYFKTAPNGWKNSVRHNLSLNKCFEKIEKPATNGGQRKGCLWAMNPLKIAKMDEEVQKWSRKDPMAIRKAMVFPEHLEALERGEMKHGSTGDSDNEGEVVSDVEENSDSEQDQEIDEHLIQTPESFVDEEEDDQQERDFDIEVQDIYDAIDMEDDKETLRLAIRQNDLIDLNESQHDYQSPKRARLNVNYSIGPAGAFHKQIHQNTINIKHESVQQQHHHQIIHHQQRQQPQKQQQQHQIHHSIHQQQQQHLHQNTTPHHNRRKMQLVNRIA